MIALYYGLTGFACAIYYRRELFKNAKNFLFMGLAPLLGGLALAFIFVKSAIDLADPANSESGDSWLGLGPPLVIGIGFLALGAVLMLLQWRVTPAFFRRRPEVAPAYVAEGRGPVADPTRVEE